jgi:hypothetical protein
MQVDQELAPLLTLLWQQGIDTTHGVVDSRSSGDDCSCQGGVTPLYDHQIHHQAYITFASRDDLYRLLQLFPEIGPHITVDVVGERCCTCAGPEEVGNLSWYPPGAWSMRWATKHTSTFLAIIQSKIASAT